MIVLRLDHNSSGTTTEQDNITYVYMASKNLAMSV